MDFMMVDQPRRQVAMRGGLALVDRLAQDRAGKRFVAATDRERRALLDEIAYTTNPDPGLSHAVAFFSSFRDLTATGFFTSKMGVADLQYQGNVFVTEWTGCPDAARFGDAWQAFTLVRNDDGTVSLQIGPWFVTAERGGGSFVSTDRTVNEAWQRFTLIDLGDGKSAFQCADGEHDLRLTALQRV